MRVARVTWRHFLCHMEYLWWWRGGRACWGILPNVVLLERYYWGKRYEGIGDGDTIQSFISWSLVTVSPLYYIRDNLLPCFKDGAPTEPGSDPLIHFSVLPSSPLLSFFSASYTLVPSSSPLSLLSWSLKTGCSTIGYLAPLLPPSLYFTQDAPILAAYLQISFSLCPTLLFQQLRWNCYKAEITLRSLINSDEKKT